MNTPQLPTVPQDQQTPEQNALVTKTFQQQMGMDSSELATARVAAVEEFLLNKQDEITDQVTTITDQIGTKTKEKVELQETWKKDAADKVNDKIKAELKKLSFGKQLATSAVVKSVEKRNGDISDDEIIITISIVNDKDRHYRDGIEVYKETSKIPTATKSTINKLIKAIDPLKKQKDDLHEKLLKISAKLANMDREERKAKAMLIAAKVNSYEGGEEFMNVITSNMPEI